MKTWPKICRILLSTLLILVLVVHYYEAPTLPVSCCLCNTTRHHAPCLVDLETGTVTELSIYDPHPTITGELAEEQYTTGTFSFVTCGEAQGYRDTTQKKIEIVVPDTPMKGQAALCAKCKDKYAIGSEERYILMELYDLEKAYSISLVEQTFSIRCYEIIIDKNGKEMKITINGIALEAG